MYIAWKLDSIDLFREIKIDVETVKKLFNVNLFVYLHFEFVNHDKELGKQH